MYAVGIVNIGDPFQNLVKQQVLSPAQINKHKYSIVCFLEAVEKLDNWEIFDCILINRLNNWWSNTFLISTKTVCGINGILCVWGLNGTLIDKLLALHYRFVQWHC